MLDYWRGVPPQQVDIRRTRLLLAALFVASIVICLAFHAWPPALTGASLALGGFLVTLLYGPLQRVQFAPKYATAIGTAATVFAIVLVLAATAFRGGLVVQSIVGATMVGAILVADRMRSINREAL
jgi:hypothetical protein